MAFDRVLRVFQWFHMVRFTVNAEHGQLGLMNSIYRDRAYRNY